MRFFALIVLVIGGALLGSCSRSDGYSQETPDDLIKTAKLMVERGEAAKLSALIYVENEDWRPLLKRVGILLGHVQELGSAVKARFPKDVAQIKAQAEEAAKKGQVPGLLQQFTGQKSPFQGKGKNKIPTQAEQKKQQDAMNAAIKRLFADPYAFLQENSGRLSTTMVSDDVAAVLWDKQPVMPPIGLTMKKDTVKGKEGWYFVLPTSVPVISKYAPRTKDEFKVFGSLIVTLDNVVKDLTKDVKSGAVTSLEQVSSKAGEKALIPAVMVFYAYDQAVRARGGQTKQQGSKAQSSK